MTVREMIRDAMQEVGAIAAGESVTDADAQVAFVRLNSMLELWQTERLTIYNMNRLTFSFVDSQAAYTIGVTATPAPDWATPVRPTYLERVTTLHNVGDDNEFETAVQMLTMDEWQRIRMKTIESTYPTRCYYNPGYPFGTLYFYPVPTDTAVDAVIYMPVPMTTVANLSADLVLAPGYSEAIRYNLALRLCPVFGRPPDPSVAALAVETKAQIKRANLWMPEVSVDPALREGSGAFDIFTGGLV